jgi:hypothetical protein
MKTKPLYVLICNAGDGSNYLQFSMSSEWIAKQQERDNNGELDYDSVGVDGDGFSYTTLNIPEEATPESLGIGELLEDQEEDEEE